MIKVVEVKKEGKKMDKVAELMSLPAMDEKPVRPKKSRWIDWIFGSLAVFYSTMLGLHVYNGNMFISSVTLAILFLIYCVYRVVVYVERRSSFL